MSNAVEKVTAMNGPDPRNPHPMSGHPRVGFLKPLVDHPQIEIAWWNWPAEKISRNLRAIRGADLAALKTAAETS